MKTYIPHVLFGTLWALFIGMAACEVARAEEPRPDETYCQNLDLGGFAYDVVDTALTFASSLGIDLGGSLPFIENVFSGLREASKGKDGELKAYTRGLAYTGLSHLAEKYGWQKIWSFCDELLPIFTSVMYRERDGIPRGFLPRVAMYCYQRGDIDKPTAETVASVWWTLEFSEEEKDTGIVWFAEEVAAVRNERRIETEATDWE